MFVGAEIDVPSEREFLQRLRRDMEQHSEEAVVLANFLAGPRGRQRQIDALVATKRAACVVELKSYTSPVEGGVNGPWVRFGRDGDVRSLGSNPYRQALECKFAVSDELGCRARTIPDGMRLSDGQKHYKFMEGVLCFFPDIPEGSRVPAGDYKVRVIGYGDLITILTDPSTTARWPLPGWLGFAKHLNLNELRLDDSAGPHGEESAEFEVDTYLQRFTDYLQLSLQDIVPTRVTVESVSLQTDALQSRILDGDEHFLLVGRSGCGKTHFLRHLALAARGSPKLPIIVDARYFDGRLDDLLDRGVAHGHSGSASDLLDQRPAGSRLLLAVDAINECPPQHRDALLRGLQALAIRKSVQFVLSDHEHRGLPQEISGAIAEFAELGDTEKASLVQQYGGGIEALGFPVLDTPYELALACECAGDLGESVTRSTLLNAFVRRRLGALTDAPGAFGVLVEMARRMSDRLCASLDVAEFYRLAERADRRAEGDRDTPGALLGSDLIELDRGQCSFRHELLQRFFESEALLIQCDDSDELAKLLASARHAHLASLVVSSQPSVRHVADLLRRLQRPDLVEQAVLGDLGTTACTAANEILSRFLERLRRDILRGHLELNFSCQDRGSADQSPMEATDQMIATAAGRLAVRGEYLQELEPVLVAFDRTWIRSATGDSDALSSAFASVCYFGQGPLGTLLEPVRNEHCFDELPGDTERELISWLDREDLGPARLFVVASLLQRRGNSLRARLPDLIERCWASSVYHIQLAALDTAQSCRGGMADEERAKTVELLGSLDCEGNLALSTMLVETLSAYDALDAPQTASETTREIERILAADESDSTAQQLAYGAISKIFEDVFQGLYWDAIEQLRSERRLKLFRMAAAGALDGFGFHLSYILQDLVEREDVLAVTVFESYAKTPALDQPLGLQAPEAWMWALVGLGQTRGDPPRLPRPARATERAWQILGEIFFWCHKRGMAREEWRSKCEPLWRELRSSYSAAAVEPLMLIEQNCRNSVGSRSAGFRLKSLLELFPKEACETLESAVACVHGICSGVHPLRANDCKRFAVAKLGSLGGEEAARLLTGLVNDQMLGDVAVQAIRDIRLKGRRPSA